MATVDILAKTHVTPACFALFLLASQHANSQVTVFSENFNGAVQPYTANAAYINANCANYITFDDTDPSVCGGSFCCSPEITDPSGGNFLFEGTNSGPTYAGAIYQITMNGTMVAGNTFTISFQVWLADNTNPPSLVPQINGANVGAAVTPSSTTGWQTLTYTYTPGANVANPVFSIYNSTAGGIGNDFALDNILITSTVPTAFVLALEFTTFSAVASTDNIDLQWAISDGSMADHFIVQQSTDGRVYTDIGQIAGTLSAPYTYLIRPSTVGLYYYRIAAIEEDGSIIYSTITTIIIDNPRQSLRVLANPVSGGRLILEVRSENVTTALIRIVSTDGKILIEQNEALQAGSNSIDVDLRNFPPGIYFVTLTGAGRSGRNETEYAKFLVR